jgi:hypothetical protein
LLAFQSFLLGLAQRDGFLTLVGQEELITKFLEASREMNIPLKGVHGHEQAMITVMAVVGLLGDVALADAEKWAAEYAARHNRRDLAACKKRSPWK